MNQRAFLAGLDSRLHAAFAGAGMADLALYWLPGADEDTPGREVRVYVDRDIQTIGDVRQAQAGRVEIAIVLEPGFEPAQKGRLSLASEGFGIELFDLGSRLSDDGSLSRWLVRRVTT